DIVTPDLLELARGQEAAARVARSRRQEPAERESHERLAVIADMAPAVEQPRMLARHLRRGKIGLGHDLPQEIEQDRRVRGQPVHARAEALLVRRDEAAPAEGL